MKQLSQVKVVLFELASSLLTCCRSSGLSGCNEEHVPLAADVMWLS